VSAYDLLLVPPCRTARRVKQPRTPGRAGPFPHVLGRFRCSRPHLSVCTPQPGHVQPPHRNSSRFLGTLRRGAGMLQCGSRDSGPSRFRNYRRLCKSRSRTPRSSARADADPIRGTGWHCRNWPIGACETPTSSVCRRGLIQKA